MPAPIIGDKFPAQHDISSTRSETKTKPDSAQKHDQQASPANLDSVQVRNAALLDELRPLSDNIRSPQQAANVATELQSALNRSPEQAVRAHGPLTQAHVEALLNNSL